MKISRDRFDEIVSAYLDGEASPEELDLLAKCIRDDRRMAEIFYKACRIHAATCAMYGKKAVFARLDGVNSPFYTAKKTSAIRAAAEWAAVVALMLTSATLVWICLQTMPERKAPQSARVAGAPRFPQKQRVVVGETIATENGTIYSIITLEKAGAMLEKHPEE